VNGAGLREVFLLVGEIARDGGTDPKIEIERPAGRVARARVRHGVACVTCLVLALLTGCGVPRVSSPLVERHAVSVARTPPRSCGGTKGTASAGTPLPNVPSDTRRGGGYVSFRGPADFVEVPLEEVDEVSESESPLYYLGVKRLAAQRSVWVHERNDDELRIASIEILRHDLIEAERVRPFEAVVVERFSGLEPFWEPKDPVGHRLAFNWVLAWSAGERDVVEWAHVAKGCERMEIYERFVRDGAVAWEVRIQIEPSADDSTLARWLATAFDAPLDLPAPPGRRSLAGSQTPR
jgi:hypothetical protein